LPRKINESKPALSQILANFGAKILNNYRKSQKKTYSSSVIQPHSCQIWRAEQWRRSTR